MVAEATGCREGSPAKTEWTGEHLLPMPTDAIPFIQLEKVVMSTTQAQLGCKPRGSERLMSWWSSSCPAEHPACILQAANPACFNRFWTLRKALLQGESG